MAAHWVRQRMRLAAGTAAGVLACAAGAGIATAPGAAAVTMAPAAARHVSPFGVGAARAARHAGHPATGRAAAASPTGTAATTLFVSNTVPVGHNTGCASPGYPTISAALGAAADGDIIKVCAGTYPEQVAITKSVALQAKGAVTIQGPASPASDITPCDADGGTDPNQAVVDVCGAITVSMTGFTVSGGWPSNACDNSLYGVTVLGTASLTMSNSTVQNVGGDPQTDGCQGGVGIQVGLATSATTADPGTATLTNVAVQTYQKNGITVDGAGSKAAIAGATVTGTGPTTAIAQNGIQVSDGATGTITSSTVTGDECNDSAGGCGPDGFTQVQSAGILLFDAGKTSVSGTTVSTSDIGVYSVEDVAWNFYTPPSPFTAVNENFSGMGLNNRYENAYLDQGKATLSGSTLSGGEIGIEVPQYSGETTPAVSSTFKNTITGASTDAILLASDDVKGDKAPSLTVTKSSLDISNAGGIVNQSHSVVAATNNWWGDATGPSDWSFGTGSSVSSDVNFFPWATDTTYSVFEPCTTGTTVTSTSNDQVLCAPSGSSNAFLANGGTGDVLLIGNSGNDQLVGSHAAGSETWIIGGKTGANTINGKGGTGFIQKRGDLKDTVVNAAHYTIAAK